MYRMLFLLLACLLLARPALAQTPDPLEQRFEEAERYYKLQQYDKALEIYSELYLKTGSPEFLYNIGQCYRLLGRYDEALRSYRNFIRDLPDSPMRGKAEELIQETEAAKQTAASTQSSGPEPKKFPIAPTPLYLTAAGLGVLGGVTGALTLRSTQEAKTILDAPNGTQEQLDEQLRRAKITARLSDISLIGALLVGGVGVWAGLHNQKNNTSAVILPNQVALSVEF